MVTTALLVVGCASTFPSSRLDGAKCHPTPGTMARVTYEQVADRVAIGCAGCPEVYVAAQYRWLAARFPGYVVREHSSQSPLDDQKTGVLLSCFQFGTPDGLVHDVCFADSGWCTERGENL